jgi:DNA polymerase/3'-5' exonuclease PolX
MSDNEKRPYAQMMTIARAVVERLRPACQRIEIAGSLRRHRPMVGDIEICAIPIMPTDLFGEPLN